MRPAFVQLRLPRNPLLRLLLAALGIILLSFFALAGAALAATVLAILGLRTLWWKLRGGHPGAAPAQPSDVIEGDYIVIEKVRASLPPRQSS